MILTQPKTKMSRKAQAPEQETKQEAAAPAMVAGPETPEETTAPEAKMPRSVQLFDEIRGVVASLPRQEQAKVASLGVRRYDSGNSRPNGMGRAIPIYYPYLFSKNIYPQGMVSLKEKIEYVRSQMIEKAGDRKIDLLAADLAKVCEDAGVELPEHLTSNAVREALLNEAPIAGEPTEAEIENLF